MQPDFAATTLHYKVLGNNLRPHHGGTGVWTPGKPRSVQGELISCQRGKSEVGRSLDV